MKQIIWTSEAFFDDEARKAYEAETRDRLEDDGYCVSDNEWAEIISGIPQRRATKSQQRD